MVIIVIRAAMPAAVQPVLRVHVGGSTSSTVIGLLFGIAALASIIANPLVGRFVGTTVPRMLIGTGVVGDHPLLVTDSPVEPWQTGIGIALIGLSPTLVLVPGNQADQRGGFRLNRPTLSGSFALYNLAYAAALPNGPLLSGFVMQQTGFTTAMVMAAIRPHGDRRTRTHASPGKADGVDA